MKLRTKLLIILLPLAIIPIVAISVPTILRYRHNIAETESLVSTIKYMSTTIQYDIESGEELLEDQQKNNMEYMLEQLATNINYTIKSLSLVLKDTAQSILLTTYTSIPDSGRESMEPTLVEEFDRIINSYSLSELSLLTPNGKEVFRRSMVFVPPDGDPFLDISQLPNLTTDESSSKWYQSLLNTMDPHHLNKLTGTPIHYSTYFEPDLDANNPVPVLSITYPVKLKDNHFSLKHGSLVGFLRLSIPIENLCRFISESPSNLPIEIAITDFKKTYLFNTNPGQILKKFNEDRYSQKNYLVYTRELTETSMNFHIFASNNLISKNSRRVMDIGNNFNKPFMELGDIITSQSTRFTKNLRLTIITLVGISIIAMICAILVSHYLSTPIQQLTQSVNEIEQGNLDIDPRIGRNDEISILSENFNNMRLRLKNQIEELDKVVEERTVKMQDALVGAQKADEAKSAFLANMSHEIRTPMNAIIGFAELLKETNIDAEQISYTDMIHTATSSLLVLLNDILDVAKIEAGKLELENSPFNINSVVEDACTFLSPLSIDKNTEILVNYEPYLPSTLNGDAGRIRQIIINLMSNAIKFSKNSKVYINLTQINKNKNSVSVKISVIDTGIGLRQNDKGIIFEKFSQADETSTRKYGGTGLGLAIAKELVELMNGKIGVKSEINKGSTFWIELNFQFEKDIPLIKNYQINKKSVLLIESSNDHQTTICNLFSKINIHCNSVTSIDKENPIDLDDNYDLVIISYNEGENIETVVKYIKETSNLTTAPLLLLISPHLLHQNPSINRELFSDTLMKPLQLSALLRVLCATYTRT